MVSERILWKTLERMREKKETKKTNWIFLLVFQKPVFSLSPHSIMVQSSYCILQFNSYFFVRAYGSICELRASLYVIFYLFLLLIIFVPLARWLDSCRWHEFKDIQATHSCVFMMVHFEYITKIISISSNWTGICVSLNTGTDIQSIHLILTDIDSSYKLCEPSQLSLYLEL